MNTVLTAKGLRKTYGSITAVDGLDLVLEKSEIFGLLGHNGAGKSTAIECILGTKTPDSGTVEVLGMEPRHNRKRLFERVGVQFQQTGYQDKIKVGEICKVTASLYKSPANWRELLKAFDLADKESRDVADLSGGERQKLSVLLALLPQPELVFLDELTTGLDPKARREVWKHLQRLKEKGLTILLTSHYMDEVEALCDRICILKQGKMMALGTVAEVIRLSGQTTLEDAYLWFTGEEGTEDESV